MTPHERALELLALAREDEQAASVLDTAAIGDALVGFHYQQAVEKLLKALLAERSVEFPKTHDLVRLLHLVRAEGYDIPQVEEDLALLTPFAVTLRYEEVEGVNQLDRPRIKTLMWQLRTWVETELP